MTLLRWTFPVLISLVVAVPTLPADDLLPPDKPLPEVIDHYVATKLQKASVKPAAQADDANLIRRLTLDLNGRIPTPAEVSAFVSSTDPGKRGKLVDRLIAAPAFARHLATELDAVMMDGTGGSIRDYLARALADNRPWDQIFREVLLPDEKNPKQKGAVEFLKRRVRDTDKLTTDVSTTFFGVNISCAKCHDHPIVPTWKMAHYYGMKSFFNRTYDAKGQVAERDSGIVKFKTTKGQEFQAKLMFLTGTVVDDPGASAGPMPPPKEAKGKQAKRKKDAGPPPQPPKFSARAQLVNLALQPGQRDFFSRAIVNRLWYQYFGRGLVMPLDQMHSENLPSHAELLGWLARDMEEHRYDLRRLIRGLVLSQAYSRGSRWETGDAPKADLYAVAKTRPLTPMQMATSLLLATSDPVSFPADLKPEALDKKIEGLENRARGFARLFDQPTDDFQIGVSEALLFSNNDRLLQDLLGDGGDRLMGRLKQIKDEKALIDTAVRAVLSRPPTAEEGKLLGEYLKKREDRPPDAARQIVWALLTSSEFRFNY
jgi:hypothetical protein